MNLHSLQAVLSSLAHTTPMVHDSELLSRFLGGDSGAFAELVQRYGRFVWTVCRHLSGSDAEADDAFQATFLVLLRNARKIRDAGRLSAWLHGVAYKVSAKARQAARRREARERAAAVSERNGSAVPDSAWDRALAAVHEEVGRLPETLRVPFVMCCLEGKGVTAAAEQLGWKLGTFSGRLTRAKDALLVKLNARGLTIGVVAGLGLASPPAGAVTKAVALAQVGIVIPTSVLQLTQGVIGMSMTSFKVLAAAVLLTGGLGLHVGTGWLATADAQTPTKSAPQKASLEAEVQRLQAELEKARLAAEAAEKRAAESKLEALRELAQRTKSQEGTAIEALIASGQKLKREISTGRTTKWEYDFVVVSNLSKKKFVDFLQDRENRGWEFNGTTSVEHEGKPTAIWVFRRPVGGTPTSSQVQTRTVFPNQSAPYFNQQWMPATAPPTGAIPLEKQAEVKIIEAEIAKLQTRLATLKANPARQLITLPKKDLPLEPVEMARVLRMLAEKKFTAGHYSITYSADGIAVVGDKEVTEWVLAMVKNLSGK